MSDQATDAREACIDFIAAKLPTALNREWAEEILTGLLAPSRVPCPTNCVGGLVRAFADSDQPSRMGGGGATIKCPDCSDGTIEGPSLAEQVLGLEPVMVADEVWNELDRQWILTDYGKPLPGWYRRRSSESTPTGGTT